MKTKTRDSKYEFFLFCNPYLIFLEDETILDANLSKSEKNEHENILIIETNDKFFFENINVLESKNFCITLQSFSFTDDFIYQIELFGENFTVLTDRVIFECQGMFTNQINPSINPKYIEAVEQYKSKRVSYIRNSKIKDIFS